MSFIETVKELGTVVIGAAKENPVVFAAGAVGSLVIGYGGYRAVKFLRNRPAKAAAVAAPVVAVEAVVVDKDTLAATTAAAATAALLSLTRAEADNMGMLADWNAALKAHLIAKKK